MEQEKKKKSGFLKRFGKIATIVGVSALAGYLWGNPKSRQTITKGAKAAGNKVKGWASSRKNNSSNSNTERRISFDQQQPRDRFRGQQNNNNK